MTKKNIYGVVVFVLVLLAGADCLLAQNWTGGGDMTWTQPDSNSFSPEYTTGSTATFTATGAGTVTIAAGGVTPGAVVVNSTADYTFTGGGIGGSGSLTKMGSGTLTITNANSFSGGVIINGGTIKLAAGMTSTSLGDPGNVVTFTGTGTLEFSSDTTLSQGFAINAGVTGTLKSYMKWITINNSLAGSGTLDIWSQGDGNGSTYVFTSTSNTFSGDIVIYNASGASYLGHLTMNSLDDTPGRRIKMGNNGNSTTVFNYGSGAVVPLVLSNRRIELYSVSATLNNNAANVNCTVTVNTDLIVSKNANMPFTLGGSNSGNNTFAGAITNRAGYATSLTKANAGKWILSGTNNYSGGTTVSAGTLVLSDINTGSIWTTVSGGTLSISNMWSVPTGYLTITNSGKVRLDYVGSRSIAGLTFGGTSQPPGMYNSSNSPAYIEGTGNLVTGYPTYMVTYIDTNALGGTVPVDWSQYTNGQSVTVMGTGTLYRTKAAFRGWTTQPNGGGIRYSKDGVFVLTNNTQLFSYWTEDGTVITIR